MAEDIGHRSTRRFAVTHERRESSDGVVTYCDGWEFRSQTAVVLDAPDVGAAARAYHRIISDPASGLDVDRPGDVREVGVLEMVPVGDLVVGDFVGLGPDRKHSAEALDVLFGYWAGAVTVARDGG